MIIKGHRLNVNWLNDEVVRKDEIDFEEDQDGENELQFHAPDKHGFSEILSKFDEKVVRMFFKISGLTDCELLRYAREYTTDNKSSKSAVVRGTRQIPDICGRPIWCVENFFRNFGECVLRLGSAWLNDIQCNMASKWCPNIQELKCRLFDRETPDKMRELVARLKTLDVHFFGEEIDLGDWYGTDMQMEKLSVVLFNGALVRLPNGPLPKLKELTISHSPMNASERFFMHNLQIEKLTFVQVLDRQNPHKTQLSFIRKPIIQRYMWINTTDIVEILENLKTMQFYNELDRVLWDALTAFYRSKIPVEYVKIHQDVLPDTTEIVPFIARLKSIRRLNIKQMPLSDDDLISLSQSLNALEEFKLWSNSESKKAPKMSGVRRFVNYAEENLRKVRFIYRLTNGDYNNPLDVNELGVAVEIAQAKDIDFQVHLYSENDEIDFDKLEVSI